MSKSIQSTKVQSERVSLVASENTVTGGQPATGYGVKSYERDSTTTGTSKTASHSAAGGGGMKSSCRGTPTGRSASSKALSQSVNVP